MKGKVAAEWEKISLIFLWQRDHKTKNFVTALEKYFQKKVIQNFNSKNPKKAIKLA